MIADAVLLKPGPMPPSVRGNHTQTPEPTERRYSNNILRTKSLEGTSKPSPIPVQDFVKTIANAAISKLASLSVQCDHSQNQEPNMKSVLENSTLSLDVTFLVQDLAQMIVDASVLKPVSRSVHWDHELLHSIHDGS